MSGNRTRGLLRAAALLAVGASPLLASAASAAEAPTDIVDGTIGHAPEVGQAAKLATDLLSGQALKLPSPLSVGAGQVQAPKLAAPALTPPGVPAVPGVPGVPGVPAVPGVPGVPQVGLPMVGDALAPQGRALPSVPAVPLPQPPVAVPQLPDVPPQVGALPVHAPQVG